MSFKSVQSKIARQGYSKDAAGAILASVSRNASQAAKAHNPKLLKVLGAKKTAKPAGHYSESPQSGSKVPRH